jgi:hypothetical protein
MKRILLFFIFLFIFSSLLIISNHNIYLFEEGGFKVFNGLYFSWISNLFSNTFSFTANVINMDWFPENITKNYSK